MKKANYHHGDLRNSIFKSCHKLLQKKKPQEISLRTVADMAGVSHTAIYRHFKDKDELLEVMASYGFDRLARSQKKAFDQASNPKKGFVLLGLAYIKFALVNPNYYRLMFQTKTVNPSQELKRSKIRSYSVLLGSCKTYLESKNKNTNHREYAIMAWSLVHGYSNLLIETDFPKSEASSLNKSVLSLAEDILNQAIDSSP
ncbi:TetR/AcrR family transcriptional regulator [Leptospira ilyithenensis]|uniref:TetR/AcrR family transcriptional regulator n=1 Tax=Leptospira ilyithenensis TaxID=2484901 RepID=A0A4R9LU07_9LEPT|nr:TetR/AcrR family transcriptional regulator [Leptospira ilyithenensis]TGN13701.1 TetR/AcrR family transcriptional regulator [Leptospira ilyithenensis]